MNIFKLASASMTGCTLVLAIDIYVLFFSDLILSLGAQVLGHVILMVASVTLKLSYILVLENKRRTAVGNT